MSRAPRIDVGGEIYHVINRANGRLKIFEDNKAYQDFEDLLIEAKKRFEIDIFAYVLMPNHWHLLLSPKQDREMARAMQWLGTTHTRRFHIKTNTIGGGHLYQGRYKSFLVQDDKHFLTVLKYIERNPVRAKLIKRAEGWRWGSAFKRIDKIQELSFLNDIPTPLPRNYIEWINIAEQSENLSEVRQSVVKGVPYGGETWRDRMVKRHDLVHTLRNPGRPKNGD